MSEARARFVERFGEDAARAVEQAADLHIEKGDRSVVGTVGSDPFRWAVLMVLSFSCVENNVYRLFHRIPDSLSWELFDAWLKEPEQRSWLGKHDGDIDYIALMCGRYDEYVLDDSEVM